jgi:hypothetical protein
MQEENKIAPAAPVTLKFISGRQVCWLARDELGLKNWAIMEYLHNLTDVSQNCVLRHLKVPYNTIFTDRINPIFVVLDDLSDCVNRQFSVGLCK